jgi:hypothetical protein
MSVALISFCSFLSGVGSCAAFQAALKTATLNWPTHRGSATACPLAAFGLSAFFYTVIAGIAFPGDTSSLLMFLSLATSLLVAVSIPFLIIVDRQKPTIYAVLPTSERSRRDSNILHRTKTHGSRYKATAVPHIEPSKHHFLHPCHLAVANALQQTKTSPALLPRKSLPSSRHPVTSSMTMTQRVRSRLTHTV